MQCIEETLGTIENFDEFKNVMQEGREGVYASGFSPSALKVIHTYLLDFEKHNFAVSEGHHLVVEPNEIKSKFIEFEHMVDMLEHF